MLQKRSELVDSSVYSFIDDSHHASVALGAGFSLPQPAPVSGVAAIRHLVASAALPQVSWQAARPVMSVQTASRQVAPRLWHIACEEAAAFPSQFRATLHDVRENTTYSYEVKDDFSIVFSPCDVKEQVPESVYGCVLGVATGVTEAKNLLHDKLRREQKSQLQGAPQENLRSDWRAPRFSFTLQTAPGSPFAERWGFAIQEAVQGGGFRVWVEQQRTGREIYLRLRSDGVIEGLQELEELPAAVHGAGLGMVMGIEHVAARMRQQPEMAVDNADGQVLSLPVFCRE